MYVKGRVHVFWHICEFSFPTKYTYLLELLRILRSLRGVLVVANSPIVVGTRSRPRLGDTLYHDDRTSEHQSSCQGPRNSQQFQEVSQILAVVIPGLDQFPGILYCILYITTVEICQFIDNDNKSIYHLYVSTTFSKTVNVQ